MPVILEGTGLEIWLCVDGVKSNFDIARTMSVKFGASPDDVMEDVIAFLGDLYARGLIVATSEWKA
ncbi:PqqD family protein [Subtercola sp. RTI3]|uniref:PqqD family protein n=1 Tax=Subtercola sp. RTI3 TaxID=3048639 RepID=UPI003A599258